MEHLVESVALSTGLRLDYAHQGDPSGVPLLLLHGLGDSWRSWERVLPHLPESARAIVPTLRGHGDASRPPGGDVFREFAARDERGWEIQTPFSVRRNTMSFSTKAVTKMPHMKLTNINGVDLEVRDSGGPGEPVVFVHGGMGDECFAVIQEPALTERYRVIHYHRRGYGRSTVEGLPLTIEQQAADCRAVMQHLGIDRAHLAGLSYGGTILLQFAVDHPEAVQSVALFEPGLPSVFAESSEYGEASAAAAPLLAAGDVEGAMNTLFGVIAPGFRKKFDETLPEGWYERWIADCERVIFPYDVPALEAWQYTAGDAAQITAPVLNVTGARTASFFTDIHETIQSWIPHADRAIVPAATHAMLAEQPQASAELLDGFFARHPAVRL